MINRSISVSDLRLLASLLVMAMAPVAHAVMSVTQHGISWKFSADVTVGQFANGDYWVLGPVTIVGIIPASSISDGRTINGSMVNPAAGLGVPQAFDSSMTANVFAAELNAARPNGQFLSVDNPLRLAAGTSLVSTVSHPVAGNRPQLTDAAILTVLATAPPAKAFRPPYCGSDKKIIATEADIDYTRVATLPRPPSAPDLVTVANYFARPWIEINTEYGGREMHPSNNQPDYGRDLSNRLELGLLSLQLNYSDAEKRSLMVRLIQYGLDVCGSAVAGGFWREAGGHNQGRKMPLLLAAAVLGNDEIRTYGDAGKHLIFQEDRQTFYVNEATVSITQSADWNPDPRGGNPTPYTKADLGLPEWGINHVRRPANDNKEWATPYRSTSNSSTIGHVLTAHIMGLRTTWNWEPLFDYYDRYWKLERETRVETNTPSAFERDMWAAFRALSPTVVPRPRPPTSLRLK